MVGSHLHEPFLSSMLWEPLHDDRPELVSVQPGCEAGLKSSDGLNRCSGSSTGTVMEVPSVP